MLGFIPVMSHTVIRNKRGKILFEYRGPELPEFHQHEQAYHLVNVVSLKAVVQLRRALLCVRFCSRNS